MKTYACKKATPNSNKKIKNKMININININIFNENAFKTNPETKYTNVWPAKILAHNLTAKLKHLIP